MGTKLPSFWEQYKGRETRQPWPDNMVTSSNYTYRISEPRPLQPILNGPRIAVSQWAGGSYNFMLRSVGAQAINVDADTKLSDFDKLDGLVIPGGRDVDPYWYNQEPGTHTQPGDMNRDRLEIAFVKRALEKDIPILGVCRGHQLLNVAMGGTLLQHISDHVISKHIAFINPKSQHLGFIDDHKLQVNSLHHQAVDKVGKGLRIAALSEDKIVEAIEGTEHTFVVGVQWHPEMRLTPKFEREMHTLLKNFISARKK